jgi:hypothetical protein
MFSVRYEVFIHLKDNNLFCDNFSLIRVTQGALFKPHGARAYAFC